MKRNAALYLPLAIGATLLGAAALLRATSRFERGTERDAPPRFDRPVRVEYVEPPAQRLTEAPAPPEEAGVASAARQAQIRQLIETVKTSAVRGDGVMKDAAVSGLLACGPEAEAALRVEYGRESNVVARTALGDALARIDR